MLEWKRDGIIILNEEVNYTMLRWKNPKNAQVERIRPHELLSPVILFGVEDLDFLPLAKPVYLLSFHYVDE